eukprot:CAMPEP_0116828838 /NCGR_PEP_ID=MMETSP0418-20121206/3866_1 /TAXON_ID=1158023 /ORGANISM="Astrosyne radiata, Strain 13vi08-1A" /LENGTH=809 /DNA_ID=CAMNT_0004457747 /DNA_START=1 /DNA_END=2430 /DNA_ORIENTATION=+
MDEMVTVLNDDSVVAAGETLVKHGEIALDAIEGISGNKIAGDVLKVAEKAGITKESVMSQIEALNVNELLDTAGSAVTDEKARKELVSSATDTALDFVLKILPSMPVPPFDGVRDGLVYHLSNLSMEGFKVKKEDIGVEIAGMRATKNVEKMMEPERELTPEEQYVTVVHDGEMKFEKREEFESRTVKATELLIIDVRGISATLEDAVWSFEQTYMPYWKGNGKANVRLSDGSIRLQFELRKRPKQQADEEELEEGVEPEWEPVLCLHDRSCSIGQIELVLQGEGRLTWIINKLASIFKGPLRDYVVRTIVSVLTNQSGYILENLNSNLAPFWGLILRTTGLSLDELVVTDRKVITASQSDDDDNLIELVWRESLPLGMNLLLNDDSGKLKVVDFPRGSQARAVCTDKDIDPVVFNGATIVAVNGTRYELQDDLFEALKDPSRPKSILFELANPEDAERVKQFVDRTKREDKTKKDKQLLSEKEDEPEPQRVFFTREFVIKDNVEIGLEFAPASDDYGLVVKAYVAGEGGTVLAAERDDNVQIGDLLTHVNEKLVLGERGQGRRKALELLESGGQNRPLTLRFTDPYLIKQEFDKSANDSAAHIIGGPEEFVLIEKDKRILAAGFENVNGVAEVGGILLGDHLVFVNGVPVGAGVTLSEGGTPPELSEVYTMLYDESFYPVALTFARPKQEGSRWGTAQKKISIHEPGDTICVVAQSFEQIGCIFEGTKDMNMTVKDLNAVPGLFQNTMKQWTENKARLAVEEVNGQFVPSYATPSIVMNAMKRSWSSNEKVEVLFCDDARKRWAQSLQ